jgi:glutathione S-transferase
MPTIILHHYESSPFAEMIRTALGVKGLEWRSVIIPNMMPKPDLVALTGGYGRTPVLQIDSEIYCDTAAIIDVLEDLRPEPTLYPAPLGQLHRMIAGWAGAGQFAAHVGAAMRNLPEGALAPGFAEDRKRRFVGFDFDTMPAVAPHFETQVRASAGWIEATLADGRPYVGGKLIGHGDLALYANLWFLRAMPFAKDFADQIFALPRLAEWFERIAEIGHGSMIASTAAEAIEIARSTQPKAMEGAICEGFSRGATVEIRTEQSGDDPVEGTLLRCGPQGITVRRQSVGGGQVNVHFPRLGQIVGAR